MIFPEKPSSIKRTSPSEKQPSLLGILILAILTIILYGLGIHQSSPSATDLVETVVRETVRDYQF